MREEDYTNQPAIAADQWEGIVGFAALEKPVPMEHRLAKLSAHEKKAWIPHHGFWTARFYTGKVWIIGIDENLHFPALKRQARHEEDRRASLVKPLIAKPPAGRQIVRGPTFQFGTL